MSENTNVSELRARLESVRRRIDGVEEQILERAAIRVVERILDGIREREVMLTRERGEARAATRRQDEQIRVLREALRRAVDHLGAAAPVNDEESLAAWDDYHAAKMLVGRTDDAWDDEAAGRGMRRIRREALGVEDVDATDGAAP